MGCPCNEKKKIPATGSAPAPTTCRVRLINFPDEPTQIIGKASGMNYGQFKNGDRIRIRIEDYDAEPEMFVQL